MSVTDSNLTGNVKKFDPPLLQLSQDFWNKFKIQASYIVGLGLWTVTKGNWFTGSG